MDSCFDRCRDKYEKPLDNIHANTYYCAKGCAEMAKGKVKDKDKFCKIDKEDRLFQCNTDCHRVSGIQRQKDACHFGCEFWRNGKIFSYLLSFSINCTICVRYISRLLILTLYPILTECGVDSCFDRCKDKYKKPINNIHGNTYYCAKACAELAKGKVKDKDKFCKIDQDDRLSQCNTDCQRASRIQRHKDACRFGCEFWRNGQILSYSLSCSIICTICVGFNFVRRRL